MNAQIEERLRAAGLEIERADVGRGGSATVHQVRVTRATEGLPPEGTLLAVKEYHSTILTIPNQLERIRQEARLGQTLNHPNVIRAYTLLEPAEASDGGYLLLLDWIDGLMLDVWYASLPRPIEWELLQRVANGIVDGVSALHEQQVLHRDIKPENIMVRTADNTPVVMDVGVAEITSDDKHTLHTSLKDFVGSTRYASPQFIMGESFAAQDDVYSLMAAFHLLFTGKNVFHNVVRKPLIPIKVVTEGHTVDALIEGIPAPLRLLLLAGLHRDRARRPSLAQVKECLQDPNGARFLTEELEKQNADSRGYKVLRVVSAGAGFFADLAADAPREDDEYRVVRRGPKVHLDSYNREVATEQWIANAVLKHVNNNVGYFITTGKRWQEGSRARDPFGGITTMLAGTPGQWIEYEKLQEPVKAGDVVLKREY